MIEFAVIVILIAIGLVAWTIRHCNEHYPPPQPEKTHDPVGDILEEMKQDNNTK